MKRLFLAAGLLSLFSSCGGSDRAATVAGLAGVATKGSTVYTSTCASCHQTNGKGDPSRTADGGVLYPSLITKAATLSPTDFIGFTINGVPGTSMVSYSTLTDQQLADLYAYIKTL